jgi:uncharacterized protein involved in exopolysaccharide biosynthesis
MEYEKNKNLSQDHPINTDVIDRIEIDLIEKANVLWKGRKIILIITVFFSLFGLFHYSSGPEEFESTATLIQEIETTGRFDGGNALLRSLAGSNISSMGGSGNLAAAARGRAPLPVNLYPTIINSTDFMKDLIYREFEFSSMDTTLTLYDYFKEYHQPPVRASVYGHIGDMTFFLPLTILKETRTLLRNASRSISTKQGPQSVQDDGVLAVSSAEIPVMDERLLSVTRDELRIINNMRTRINVIIGGSTTEIITTLPDPKAAALVNAALVERIQEYMTEYRIEKARQNLEDVIEQYEDARLRYEEAQLALAEYLDSNINVRSNIARTREEYLRDQRNLRFNVYNNLAQEVEQARLSLNQEIPVFNMLERPNIPISPSTGSSNMILVFSVLLGLFAGGGWVLIRSSSFVAKKFDSTPT